MHTIILITGVHTHGDDVHFSDKTIMYCRECKQEVETYTLGDDEAIEQASLSRAINTHTEAQDALAEEASFPGADVVNINVRVRDAYVFIKFNEDVVIQLPDAMILPLSEEERENFLVTLSGLYHAGVVAGREERA